jgi:SM-20-related protein
LEHPLLFGTEALASLMDAIAEHGYAIAPGFLDARLVAALRSQSLRLEREDRFAAAAIGRGAQRIERSAIRGDRICWLDPMSRVSAERLLQKKLEALRLAANRALQLGLFDFEGHYSIYRAGEGYARHLDRFQDNDARVLSLVVYLNDRWRAEDGGMLRLHPPNSETIDVMPEGGALAVFLSDRIAHQVLPANRPRLSIAGWFRRRD